MYFDNDVCAKCGKKLVGHSIYPFNDHLSWYFNIRDTYGASKWRMRDIVGVTYYPQYCSQAHLDADIESFETYHTTDDERDEEERFYRNVAIQRQDPSSIWHDMPRDNIKIPSEYEHEQLKQQDYAEARCNLIATYEKHKIKYDFEQGLKRADEEYEQMMREIKEEEEKKKRDNEKEAERKRIADEREAERLRLKEEREDEKRLQQAQQALAEALDIENELKTLAEQLQEKQIPEKLLFEHRLIVANSGGGKTTFIEHEILRLRKETKALIVVIDPKGEMVRRLEPELWPYCIPIDPMASPALNLFRIPDGPFREQQISQMVDLFQYLFESANFKFTGKQEIGFQFIARLMYSMPDSTLYTLFDLVGESVKKAEQSKFYEVFLKQPPIIQRFFLNDFYTEFNETRSQVKARLYMLAMNPQLEAIFGSEENRLNWHLCKYDTAGITLLVDTGFNKIGYDASTMLGRYAIASVIAAATAGEKRPVYLFVDEAQLFIDGNYTLKMLALLREYQCSVTLATQVMTGEPFTPAVRQALATNTAIKMTAGLLGDDLNDMARLMNVNPNDLRVRPPAGMIRLITQARGVNNDKIFYVDRKYGVTGSTDSSYVDPIARKILQPRKKPVQQAPPKPEPKLEPKAKPKPPAKPTDEWV